MAYTEISKRATIKYIKNNYDRFDLKMPKGFKEQLQAKAQARGLSVNAYILKLIEDDK